MMAAPLSLRQPGVQPADVNAQRQRPAHAATQDGAVRGAAQGRGRGRHGHRPFMMQVCSSVIYHRHLHICCIRPMQGGNSTRGAVKRSLHSPLLPSSPYRLQCHSLRITMAVPGLPVWTGNGRGQEEMHVYLVAISCDVICKQPIGASGG